MQTKAIIFDLMGVLFFKREDYVPDRMIDDIDKLIGTTIDDSSLKQKIFDSYGLAGEELEKVLEKGIDKYDKFYPLWKMLPELRKKYKLAVINNGTALTLDYLGRKHSIKSYFDLFVSSALEGVRKPDPEIFARTADRLGVKMEECLFMDDLEENIEGAKKSGMRTVWWKDKNSGFEKFKEFIDVCEWEKKMHDLF